jgi:hypothetical protein
VPPPAPVPVDPLAVLRARNRADGLGLDAWTACAEWRGERLDLGYALDVLHPLAGAGDSSAARLAVSSS